MLLYAQEGKIKTKRERNASNQIATMFHTGDVERFGLERANLEVVQGYGRAKKLPDSRVELVEQTEQTAVQALPALQPLGSWMTLDEAVTVSQLSRAWLLAAAEAGTVSVRDMGKGARGGRWRYLKHE